MGNLQHYSGLAGFNKRRIIEGLRNMSPDEYEMNYFLNNVQEPEMTVLN